MLEICRSLRGVPVLTLARKLLVGRRTLSRTVLILCETWPQSEPKPRHPSDRLNMSCNPHLRHHPRPRPGPTCPKQFRRAAPASVSGPVAILCPLSSGLCPLSSLLCHPSSEL